MKKIVSALVITLCIVIAMPAQAQIKFGVKGGLNLSKLDLNKSDLETDNFTGFFIGPMAEVGIPIVGLAVDGALLFSQKGGKIADESIKENGLEIPVNLKYNIGLGDLAAIYLAAGPSFYFNFSGDGKISNVGDIQMKNSQIAINLGAGVKLLNHLQVGVNYNMPLSNSAEIKGLGDIIDADFKTKVWQVSVAYLF